MAALPWYKWEPGAIPYLDRISYEARGILWSWADDHWRGMQVPSPLFEASETATKEANKVWPTLRQWLDEKRITAEENSKSKHINAVNANRIRWESKRNPNGIQDIDIELEKEQEKEKELKKTTTPLPPKGGGRIPRAKKLAPYPKEVVSFVEALSSEWPTKRKDGSKVESDIVKTVSRVNSILNDNPDITIADLGAAARSWIKTSPNWPNAMEFWFGPGKGQEPPWRIEVQAKMTLDQLNATEQEQAANDF